MKALSWIGLILGLIIVIAAATLGGFIWGRSSVPAPTPTLTPTPTPAPHGTGVYNWEEVAPGDCISDFTSAFQNSFTVVDCTFEHNAQMLLKQELPAAPDEYPGTKALAVQVPKLCASKENYNGAAAYEYTRLTLVAAYPQTFAEWSEAPVYECFISAPAGTVLTTDLMPAGN